MVLDTPDFSAAFKHNEITEDLPVDSPLFLAPFTSVVMIGQNFTLQYFPTHSTINFIVSK